MEHELSCPRSQFWDAGEFEAPCTCGFSKIKHVDMHGNCSRCGGVHYGTGRICVYSPHSPYYKEKPDAD